jgi:hypothetical protein
MYVMYVVTLFAKVQNVEVYTYCRLQNEDIANFPNLGSML